MARAMMSLTTSLGRPFSAESCARPVTSSRFTSATPLLIQFASRRHPEVPAAVGRQKKWGRPTFSVPDAASGGRTPSHNYIKWWESPLPEERLAAAPLLREVIADVRKVVRELIAEKDHRDDYCDRDDRDDECILD